MSEWRSGVENDRGERMAARELAQDRADEDRAAADVLAAALRAVVRKVPRCQEQGCTRVASMAAGYVSDAATHCAMHCAGRRCHTFKWDHEIAQAEAAIAAWEARGR